MTVPAPKPHGLATVPNEILEHIALFSGISDELGPPSALFDLLTINRHFHDVLALKYNPHLYSRIFAFKFDTAALLRRFGPGKLTATDFAIELQRRCIILKRIRAQVDCLINPDGSPQDPSILAVVWLSYLMMLENDGKNKRQLREYGRINEWLRQYWFHNEGASKAHVDLQVRHWPGKDTLASLAMWLFWFFLEPSDYANKPGGIKTSLAVLKLYALGAHKYPLSHISWTSFTTARSHIHLGGPMSDSFEPFAVLPYDGPTPITQSANSAVSHNSILDGLGTSIGTGYFGLRQLPLSPPPVSVPAILSYLALRANERLIESLLTSFIDMEAVSMPERNTYLAYPTAEEERHGECEWNMSERWECEWYRCFNTGDEDGAPDSGDHVTSGFKYKMGSLDGAWEGVFSYTEFTSYASLLAGAPPAILQSSLIAQHPQMWKLREHHLLADAPFGSSAPGMSKSTSSSSMPSSHLSASPWQDESGSGRLDDIAPLPSGDPIRAHIPESAIISETKEGVTITIPTSSSNTRSYSYQRYTPSLAQSYERRNAEGGVSYSSLVRDIIFTGEGHSSWGEFELVGRVRKQDGLVTVSKEYTDGDRGRWLYRGYIVGAGPEVDGQLIGRWRDTLTPMETHGYEGCFGLTKRK